MEVYTVATDGVPSAWREDARWRGPEGGGNPGVAAHAARFPSRWLPAPRRRQHHSPPASLDGTGDNKTDNLRPAALSLGQDGVDWHMVDYLRVPRQRAGLLPGVGHTMGAGVRT